MGHIKRVVGEWQAVKDIALLERVILVGSWQGFLVISGQIEAHHLRPWKRPGHLLGPASGSTPDIEDRTDPWINGSDDVPFEHLAKEIVLKVETVHLLGVSGQQVGI